MRRFTAGPDDGSLFRRQLVSSSWKAVPVFLTPASLLRACRIVIRRQPRPLRASKLRCAHPFGQRACPGIDAWDTPPIPSSTPRIEGTSSDSFTCVNSGFDCSARLLLLGARVQHVGQRRRAIIVRSSDAAFRDNDRFGHLWWFPHQDIPSERLPSSVGMGRAQLPSMNIVGVDQACRGKATCRRCTLAERGEDAIHPVAQLLAINVHANGIAGIISLSRCGRQGQQRARHK